MKCHYCDNPAIKYVVWLKDKNYKPARIKLPWCGCDLHQALIRKWGGAWPVTEGEDYESVPLPPPVTVNERRGTAFPLLIRLVDSGQQLVVETPQQLPSGVVFTVLETNYEERMP